MKLDTFNRLPLDQKTSYMWDHGVCLAQRIIENRYILCIFEVNGFFVEAIYSRRNNRVNAILPIADIPEWEGYVDQVLTNLLKLNSRGALSLRGRFLLEAGSSSEVGSIDHIHRGHSKPHESGRA